MQIQTPVLFFEWRNRFSMPFTSSRSATTVYDGVSKNFRTESITKYTLTTINTHWEAIQRVMAAKLTRLTHKIAIQLHLVAESCTIWSSRSRRPMRKLLDTPSYNVVPCDPMTSILSWCACCCYYSCFRNSFNCNISLYTAMLLSNCGFPLSLNQKIKHLTKLTLTAPLRL
jgi:hypothetical protein